MNISRKLLYFASLAGLALTAALAVDRVGTPSIAPALLWVVLVAALAGAPGLVHRRAWPVALILVPLGAYVVARSLLPVPPSVDGLGEQWRFYAEQLRIGGHAYGTQRLPFDMGASLELKLLLSVAVYSAVATASFLALSLRRALPAVAVLLALLGFGLTIDQADRVLWLPLLFLLLAGCVLVLSRSLDRDRWRPRDAVAGVGTAVIASLLALTLVGTTSVAAGAPWQDWHTWGPVTTDDTVLVFDWMENYPRLLDPETDAEVMRVKSPIASYWRANVLDSFTGSTWFSAQSSPNRLQPQDEPGPSTYAVPVAFPEPLGKLVTMTFESSSVSTDYFFTGGAPRFLVLDDPQPVFATSSQALWAGRRMGSQLKYTLTAVVPELQPTDLVGQGREYPGDVAPYLLLPIPSAADVAGPAPEREWRDAVDDNESEREWLGLYRLNRDIVGDATDPYQVALLVEEFLRFNYSYSLSPPSTEYRSPYAAFLFDTRVGYCQHFAGAMAALLRFNGVPARVAVGFTSGTRVTHDTFVVGRNQAHAWVEAYFPSVGWVSFDPTPGRSVPGEGPSSTSVGFQDPFQDDQAGGGLALDTPATGSPDLQKDRTTGQGFGSVKAPSASSGAYGWLAWLAALAGAVIVWPAARLLLRSAVPRRGSLDRRLRASLAMVYTELKESGVRVPASQTLEETARMLKSSLDVDASELVDRVQAVLFGGRAATPQDLADVARLRRELRRRLRAQRGWTRTVAALYGLPSGIRG